jgi:hypothetical protein
MSRFSVAGPPTPAGVPALALAPVSASPVSVGGGGGSGASGGGGGTAVDPRDLEASPAQYEPSPPSGERGTLGASVTVPDWTILAGVAAVVGIGYLVLRRKGHV